MLAFSLHTQAADSFQLSSIFVNDWVVFRQTVFNFQLQISRGSSYTVQNGDYLLIQLPADTSAYWNQETEPSCLLQNGGIVKKCSIQSSKAAKVVYGGEGQVNLVLAGSISNFVNPESNKMILGIQISLYTKYDVLKMQESNLSLKLFKASQLNVTLSSSSNVIGKKNLVLKLNIVPERFTSHAGLILVNFPEYYKDAGSDTLISTTVPDPCSSNEIVILTCKFSQRLNQLSLSYKYADGKDHSEPFSINVGQFNNPIISSQSGFQVIVLDSEEYLIAQSGIVELSGITQPAQFKSWDFNYVDKSSSAQYATHQFIIQSSMPLAQNCRFKIVYPKVFKIDQKLTSIEGSGFFKDIGGLNQFTADYANNEIEVIACNMNYGSFTDGILTLKLIFNQPYVKTTDTFKLYMTELNDINFKKTYQKLESGFIIEESRQRPGDMQGYIETDTLTVQTFTPLTFNLKPSMNLSKNAFMVLVLPQTLDFQGPSCTVTNMKGGFSQKMYCQRLNYNLTLLNPFDYNFVAKSAEMLSMQVREVLMPFSVQKLGSIKLIMYDIDEEGKTRAFDLFEENFLKSLNGATYKISEVQTQSNVTSLKNQEYIFHFKLQHSVPIGGYFRIQLPQDIDNGVQVSDPKSQQSCFYIKNENEELGVDCHYYHDIFEDGLRYIDINCTENIFPLEGTSKNQTFKFKILGLTNPRVVNKTYSFTVMSTDAQHYPIDINMQNEQFNVMMTKLQPILKLSVDVKDKTNGAATNYTISIVPSTWVKENDLITIKFPPKVKMPFDLKCDTKSALIKSFTCSMETGNLVTLKLTKLSPQMQLGDELIVTLINVTNPVSLRPTSNFTNVKIIDSQSLLDISNFEGEGVFIQNQIMAKINKTTADIKQSSYETLEDSEVTLTFQTNNTLPPESVILVSVPMTLPVLYNQSSTCKMKLNNGPDKQNLCIFNGYDITFQGGFTELREGFSGQVQLMFKVKNPVDNQRISTQAFKISIYDDSDMHYGIEQLTDTLYPNIGCEYPCKECLPGDKKYCTACLPQMTAPQFLHKTGQNTTQTCIDLCPEGFTSNGSKNPRKCMKCADTCQKCAQNDNVGDVNNCTQCHPLYPNFWLERQSCHSSGCPDGSWSSNLNICTNCNAPCKFCSGTSTCTSCDAFGPKPYLDNGDCVDKCPSTHTPIQGKCERCNSPCASCKLGLKNSCLSCDNTDKRQFLYGNTCVVDCPAKTTKIKIEDLYICKGCEKGCEDCDENDQTKCKKCLKGYSLLDNVCYDICPSKYIKSADGSVCEERTYPLDSTFVAFPVLGTFLFFLSITMASYWLTARRSLIHSTLLAFLGPIEMAACLYQFIYTLQEGRNWLPIRVGSICVFTSGIIQNWVFIFNLHKHHKNKESIRDYSFINWRNKHKLQYNVILVLTGMISTSLYRLIYCRLFRVESFDATALRHKVVYRPVYFFSCIKLLMFNLPLVVVDIYGITILSWGNQVYMTMIESLVLSFLDLILFAWEFKDRDYILAREKDGIDLVKLQTQQSLKYSPNRTGRRGRFGEKLKNIVGNNTVAPEEDHQGDELSRNNKAANLKFLTLAEIGHHLSYDVSMQEVQMAAAREKPDEKTKESRIQTLTSILEEVHRNQNNKLNGNFDALFDFLHNLSKNRKRRADSCKDVTKTAVEVIACGLNEKKQAKRRDPIKRNLSLTSLFNLSLDCRVDEEEKRDQLQKHWKLEKQKQFDKTNNKGHQYIDPIDNNVFADARDPPQKIENVDTEAQTEQEKVELEKYVQINQLKAIMKCQVTENLINKLKEQNMKKKIKSKMKQGRGKKSEYKNAIDEEDDEDSGQSDVWAQNLVETQFNQSADHNVHDMMTLAMQVDQDRSLTSFYDLNMLEREFSGSKVIDESQEQLLHFNPPGKGISLSRVSGDLDLSDEDAEVIFEKDAEGKKGAEVKKPMNVQAWIKDSSDKLNQRNFNINSIIGNFMRDSRGAIINRKQVLRKERFTDADGNVVNEKGYLLDFNHLGDIRSKYTFETVFSHHQLTGPTMCELPLPYRIENHNFNPHECLGNFDYDHNSLPIVLKNKDGKLVDKHRRQVNEMGWLVDLNENVVDNRGHVKFIKAQLNKDGEVPRLYNYEGVEYRIKDIIGQFDRDVHSKEIILCENRENNKFISCDKRGFRVNSKGYLLDDKGNIVDKRSQIIWRSHELMYSEPPKIFEFTEFSLNWILGDCDHEMLKNPKHEDRLDLQGRKINSMGYLIDHFGNIIDVYRGNIVFRKEVLEKMHGQESEIPKVFRSGKLREPQLDTIEREIERKYMRAKGIQQNNEDMDIDEEQVEKEKNRIDSMLQKKFGFFKDASGKEISSIPKFLEQKSLLQQSEEDDYASGADPQNQPPEYQVFRSQKSKAHQPVGFVSQQSGKKQMRTNLLQ